MTSLEGHSILFNPPLKNGPIEVGSGKVVNDINALYNPKVLRLLLQLYMIHLICEYMVSFSSVPFDDIENRPSISIISTLYSLLIFCVCACLLPFVSSTIPTDSSYRYMLMLSIIHFSGLALSIAGVITCLNVREMFSYDYDGYQKTNIKVNVTTYIQIMACISMALHCIGTFLAFVICTLMRDVVVRIKNNIDRRNLGRYNNTIAPEVPTDLLRIKL